MPRYFFHLSQQAPRHRSPMAPCSSTKTRPQATPWRWPGSLMLNSIGILGMRARTILVKDQRGKEVLALPFSEVPEATTRH